MGQDPHIKKGIDTMIKNYIMNAKDTSDLTYRLSVLTKLSHLAPGTEFYACDLELSGGTVNALDLEGIISCVRGKERDAFICVDEFEELYKKVTAKCWKVSPTIHADFAKFCGEMATLFSAQLMML